jgi:CubicO group peptidase (beta-lactamase class C family)
MRNHHLGRWSVCYPLLVCLVLAASTASSQTAFPGPDWEVATPQSQGLDRQKLSAAVAWFEENAPRDGVRELAIVRNGRLVWQGDDIDKRHGVWSCTKSFTSTVLGLLVDDGKCTLDTKAKDFVPELAEKYPDLTLRQLATMTSGYRAVGDEPQGNYKHGPSSTPFNPGEPLFAPPGSQYAYWDSAMNLFGLVLTRIAGEPLEDLFQRRIAGPIGMHEKNWDWGDYATIDGTAINGGAGNSNKHVFITARDMARLGHLFLNRGNWNGRQLVSDKWIAEATRIHVPADLPWAHPDSDIDARGAYGLNWWVNGVRADGQRLWPGAPHGTFAAVGHNNNRLFVVPEWNMVVVRLGLDQADRRIGNDVWGEFLKRVGLSIQGPQPGDVLREYGWAHPSGDAGGSLRVGGRLDYGGGPIELQHELDLEHATKAEVVVEKLLCHDNTRGLAIQINGHDWIAVPEAAQIPEPQWDYQHFTFPVVAVPLSQLKAGSGNTFALKVADEHSWNWPQNLIYGLQLRIYYDPAKKPHPRGRIVSPAAGGKLGQKVALAAEATSDTGKLARVDFLGLLADVNWEGDGQYRQWHYHYFKGELRGQLGTAARAPFRATWDTTWVPDQTEPIQVAARITDDSGLCYWTEAVSGLRLERPGVSVELCRPYDVPKKWVTRVGDQSQKFRIGGELPQATAAQLVWSSWSPGYMEGLLINGTKVFDREGPRYACFWHRVPLADLSVFKPGENELTTGMTPKYDGKTVHGMEVNWPGIMVLIRYESPR